VESMNSQLNLDNFFIEELVLKTNNDFQSKEVTKNQLNVDFLILNNKDNPLLFKVVLKIEINKSKKFFESAGFCILMRLSGFFSVQEKTDENMKKQLISFNAPSILYGIARGIVSEATSNTIYGRYILPTINFVELVKKKAKIKKSTKN